LAVRFVARAQRRAFRASIGTQEPQVRTVFANLALLSPIDLLFP
jgi:hypothetical protein